MRYLIAAFAITASLLGAITAAGENPLHNAKPGDWIAVSMTAQPEEGDDDDAVEESRGVIIVMRKDGNTITLAFYGSGTPRRQKHSCVD